MSSTFFVSKQLFFRNVVHRCDSFFFTNTKFRNSEPGQFAMKDDQFTHKYCTIDCYFEHRFRTIILDVR